MAPRGQSNVQEGSRGVDGEYSVKVSGWRVRGVDNDEDAHGRDRNCGADPCNVSLQTYNDDDYDASPDDSLNSSKDTVDIHAESDRESGVEESESREYRRHLRVSSDSSRHSRDGEEGEACPGPASWGAAAPMPSMFLSMEAGVLSGRNEAVAGAT